MPAVFPAALGAASAAAGAGTFLGLTATAWAVASIASTVLINGYQAKQAKKKERDQYNAAQVDRMANVMTNVTPRDLVLGRVRKGGAIYFRGSAGVYKDTFFAHLALAGHEIDGVDQIYLNDQPVTLDANGMVQEAPYKQTRRESFNATIFAGTLSVVLPHDPIELSIKAIGYTTGTDGGVEVPTWTVSGRTVTLSAAQSYAVTVTYQANIDYHYAKIWWELGSPDAAADGTTGAYFPDLWSVDHRARGVAKLFAQFTYNETAFPSGIPAMTAVIRGAKVYDPRTTLTAFSENPALLARHVYQHAYFGKATVSADEDARFVTAANACDTAHLYTLASGAVSFQLLYRASLVVPFGTPARSALDDLCQAMGGMWAFAGGELYIRAGVYTAPVMTLTDADLAVIQRNGEEEEQESISISAHRERADKFNIVNARIWDSEQQYKQVALSPYKATALITRDGEELAQEISMPGVFYAPQALHIAGVGLRDARDPLTFEAPFKLRAYPLELFDTVEVTLARYGWVGKTFMVMSRTWDRARAVIRLQLKETAALIYTPDGTFSAQGSADNTALPNPYDIDPPTLTTSGVSSGTDELVALPDGSYQTRVRVTWPAITNASITSDGGQVEIQWLQVGTSTWQSVLVNGSETEVYLVGPVDRTAIALRGRTRNGVATSDWSLQIVHTVVGKTAPPAAPTAVALASTKVVFVPSVDIDVKGYRILYNAGTNTNRSVATALHTGLVTVSPFQLPIRLYGINTIIVVAVDVVGNESAAATDTQDLGAPDVANVADEVDFVAEGYPGTISNGTVTGGILVSDADPSVNFWGSGRGTDFWHLDGSADFWGGTQYLELTYVCVYGCPYEGGALLLESDIDGPRSTIEVRIDGSTIGDYWDTSRTDFWGSDIASIWGVSGEFQPWNGSIVPTEQVGYEFRITVEAGSVQGAINTFEVRTEMPQIEQVFGSVAISASGTLIDPADGLPARTFISIEDVQVTPIGSTAVAGRVKTFPIDPVTGPEVELIDTSAAPVDGPAFVRISGF